MKKSKIIIVLSAILALIIAVAGCQSIGALDINKALVSNLTVESFEGKSNVSVKLLWNEESVEWDEELAVLKLFKDFSLDVYDLKVQDMNTMSMKGSFHFIKGEIPFEAEITSSHIVIQVDGADRPVVIDLNSVGLSDELDDEFMALQEELESKTPEIVEGLGSFLISHIPNPKNISVSSGYQTINKETVFLHKLSAEIYADEILDLIKQTLVSILNDEEGLKQLIGQMYDVFMPVIEPLLLQEDELYMDPSLSMMLPLIEDRDTAVEMLYTQIHEILTPIVADYDVFVDEMLYMQGGAEFFNDQSYLKTDLYFDNSLNMRKQDFELVINTIEDEWTGIYGIMINGSSEMWNVNKLVTVDEIDTTDALNIDMDTKPAHFLKELDEDSVLYKLLKDDLKINHTELQLIMKDSNPYYMQNQPYIVNQTTMVPVRFISEELNADVFWNHETKEVTVIDILSDREIVFTVNSDIAYVEGFDVKLPAKVELRNGSAYVPVRFIVEAFGGKVDWDGELQTVTITKD
jgi:hypothetical protein